MARSTLDSIARIPVVGPFWADGLAVAIAAADAMLVAGTRPLLEAPDAGRRQPTRRVTTHAAPGTVAGNDADGGNRQAPRAA